MKNGFLILIIAAFAIVAKANGYVPAGGGGGGLTSSTSSVLGLTSTLLGSTLSLSGTPALSSGTGSFSALSQNGNSISLGSSAPITLGSSGSITTSNNSPISNPSGGAAVLQTGTMARISGETFTNPIITGGTNGQRTFIGNSGIIDLNAVTNLGGNTINGAASSQAVNVVGMQQYTGIYQNGGNIIFNTTPVTVFSGSGGSTASGMGSTVIVTTVAAGSYAQADYSRTPYNATNVYTDWDIRYRVSYTFSLNLTNANTTVRIYAGGLASTALATSLTLTGKKCLGIELKGPVTSGTYASKVFTCDGTTAQLIPPTAPTTASTDNAFYTVVFDSMANGSTNIYWGMLGGVPTLIHTLTGCPTGLAADAINCGTGIQIVNTAASAASSITVHGGQMQTYY